MKRITINKKEYTLEFTIEASLYDDCTRSVMDMFVKGGMIQGAAEDNNAEDALENLIDTISNLPQKALTLFYAGLLEHHGPEGDGSIQGMTDAKKLLATYLKESEKSFRDVLGDMMQLMADDHFFELIGLDKMTDELTADLPKEETSSVGKATSEKK
jgi:hypothetical protein